MLIKRLLAMCIAILSFALSLWMPVTTLGQSDPIKSLELDYFTEIVDFNGNQVVFVDNSKMLSQWDLASDKISQIGAINMPDANASPQNPVMGEFRNGKLISFSTKSIQLTDFRKPGSQPVTVTPDGDVSCAALSYDGQTLVAMLDSGKIAAVYNAITGKPITIVEDLPFDSIDSTDCAVSPDGKLLAGPGNTGNYTSGALVVDLSSSKTIMSYPEMPTYHVTFSPKASYLEGSDSNETDLADLKAGGFKTLLKIGNSDAEFSNDEQIIALRDYLGITLVDVTGKILQKIPATTNDLLRLLNNRVGIPISFNFSPDSSSFVVNWGIVDSNFQPQKSVFLVWNLKSAQAIPQATPNLPTCTLTMLKNANLRSGPGTRFDLVKALAAGEMAMVNGVTLAPDGFKWYRLVDGSWVRAEVVDAPKECDSLTNIAS